LPERPIGFDGARRLARRAPAFAPPHLETFIETRRTRMSIEEQRISTPNGDADAVASDAARTANAAQPLHETRDAAALLAACAAKLRCAPKEERLQTLSTANRVMGALIRRGWIDGADVARELRRAAQDCGLEQDAGLAAISTVAESALRAGYSSGGRNPVLVRRVADVEAQRIRWLWDGRFALGKLAIIAGDPGVGKSQVAAFLAAAVSNGGPLAPGEGRAPRGSVLMLSAEDQVADTIRPRLEVAGADLTRVHVIEAALDLDGSLRRRIDLADDIATLDVLTDRIGDVRLVIIDPLSAYVGRIDVGRQSVVRERLQPVVEFAARRELAVVAITHLNKVAGAAMVRVAGSLAVLAATRAAHLVVPEGGSTRRLMLPLKNNIGNDRTGFAFRIEERRTTAWTKAPAIVWDEGPVALSANESLKPVGKAAREDGALDEAKTFLTEVLAGGPLSANEVKTEAARAGIAQATLRRARHAMGIRPDRKGIQGGGGVWIWGIPEPQK
jgi:putative DNA primase/helicase